ncbi:MAG: CPBP family intramembrane metalloprotease [Chlamydiales bacterium]|nr:CPBP family intramembrane metalloprotease [Chlamydiales bacterium]
MNLAINTPVLSQAYTVRSNRSEVKGNTPSNFSKKIAKIAAEGSVKVLRTVAPILLIAGCIKYHTVLNSVVINSISAFCGRQGWVPPILMISTCLVLKGATVLINNTEYRKVFNAVRMLDGLKRAPVNFVSGVMKVPQVIPIGLITAKVVYSIFKYLSILDIPNAAAFETVSKMSMFEVAVKRPFLEELFFRTFLQGGLHSAMELLNVLGQRLGRAELFTNSTIDHSSRMFSALTFGLGHSHQSLVQATSAGVCSYFYETWLYEKSGLFASFGLHFASNLVNIILYHSIQGLVQQGKVIP